MQVLFEVHRWRRDQRSALPSTVAASPEGSGGRSAQHEEGKAAGDMASLKALAAPGSDENLEAGSAAAGTQPGQPTPTVATRPDISLAVMHSPLPAPPVRRWAGGVLGGWRMSRGAAKRLGLRLLHNMVLWGVAIGLILSLSKIGPKWLDPGNPPLAPNCTYAAGAGFIFGLMDYFARWVG